MTFLAGPAASAINGSAVRVDGGALTTLLCGGICLSAGYGP
ncbi:hypothetical protein [Actinoplanes sp. NPDC089786]